MGIITFSQFKNGKDGGKKQLKKQVLVKDNVKEFPVLLH